MMIISCEEKGMMNPAVASVDVVVLSWNRVELTIATLKSVLCQINVNANIWVIDQGSDKNQLAALTEYVENKNEIHLVALEKNIGVPAGRNLGMRQGSAEFIICIDNDAVFHAENDLETAVNHFKTHQNIAIIGFKIVNAFTKELDISSWAYPKMLLESSDTEFLATRFCGAGHGIRRSALEKTNFYDESLFFYWEELDISYKVINLGYILDYFPEVIVLHKVSPENKIFWDENRFFYLVRNAIYLNWKFYRSHISVITICVGYFVKGIYNGIWIATLRGIFKAVQMMQSGKLPRGEILNKKAREYIRNHDSAFRGIIIVRIKNEILSKLPKITP